MSDAPSRSPIALMAALGAAVVAFMILAMLTPRMNAAGESDWLITIIGSVIAGAIAYFFLASRGADEDDTTTDEPPR